MGRRLLLLGLLCFLSSCIATPAKPRQIPWSSQTYGPDGPWQAVTVAFGTPQQKIDLLPGGSWLSNVLNTSVCDNKVRTPVCYAKKAGLFNSTASSTFEQHPEVGPVHNGSQGGFDESLAQFGSVNWAFDTLHLDATDETISIDMPTHDMLFVVDGYSILPDGRSYTLDIGNLALGSPDFNQSWRRGSDGGLINGTFLPNYLYSINQTTSSSYGLHIGSAALGIPGSLWVGGYDQSRVLGPVSVQSYGSSWLPIDLLDVGIGVADGQSPFSFGTRNGYLQRNNTSIGTALQVRVDPTLPYLNLPKTTCDNLAADLPVKYNPNLDLYLWQTNDTRYKQIISAPSILSFTFRLNGSVSQNMTIKVPFKLLNLTLSAPLVDTPTPYFPCRPTPDNSRYFLGRAFCQAAFVGVNWMETTSHNGVWWLAQAPGPNTPSVPVETFIQEYDHNIASSSADWTDSWKDTWTPIGKTATTGDGNSSTSPSSAGASSSSNASSGTNLSPGTIAAIATGTTIVALIIIAVIIFIFRKRSASSHLPPPVPPRDENYWAYVKGEAGFGPREMEGHETRDPVELGLPRRELLTRPFDGHRYEIGGTERPAELM